MLIGKKSNGGKRLRRLLASALALVLTLGIAAPAFAASITIYGNYGEVYTAYKVLDVTVSESGAGYSYTTTNSDVAELFEDYTDALVTKSESSTQTLYYITWDSGTTTDAEELAQHLATLSEERLVALFGEGEETTLDDTAATADNPNGGTGSIDDLAEGYYFVTSSLGSLCILYTAADTEVATIYDKNEQPAVSKTVSKTYGDQTGSSSVDAQVGDTVYFTVEITIPAETETLKLSDTLSNGLDLHGTSFEISINGGGYSDLSGVTVSGSASEGATTFEVILTGEYLNEATNNGDEDGTITIKYSAMINEYAIDGNSADNDAEISYGNEYNSSFTSKTTTKTYSATIKKVDNNGGSLTGAVFELEDAEENPVYVIEITDGEYRVATSSEEEGATRSIAVNEDGTVIIHGLDNETYTLIETVAPDGYRLGGSVYLEIETDTINELSVINYPGGVLPTAGGIGTTIIYIAGALLVVGGGVALYVRHRRA